ncbi:MAG TPA: DUF1501 domain-containing protein, partial [Planctomycetaceae bacterium]|nr:DUF1501 domain-containing protein [Planctomycetaceae bacterium]
MAQRAICPGPIGRRTWLQLGSLSLGALATGASPSLAQLLARETPKSQGTARDFSVILLWANGGPSHVDLFDLKPQAPIEYRGEFRPIRTNVPGIEITEQLPLLAQRADKFALVRSLHHERAEHSGGTNRFLTGYASKAANLNDSEFPEIGSVVARQLEASGRDIPLFVANTKFYGGGPAYLGPAYGPYMPLPNPRSSTGDNQYDPIPIYRTADDDALAISSEGVVTLNRRRSLLKSLDLLPQVLDQHGTLPALDQFQRRALEMLASRRTRAAFDLSQEDEGTRDRYGDTHFGKSLLTCRRLIEAGVRFVQCQAEYRLRPETGVTSNWDDHSVNSHIFNAYREKLPSFDRAVSALIDDLYARGLNERVLFVFCGEFGRTPKVENQDRSRRPGRDHWPRAMSVFLSGGGLKMGQVIGATNRRAEEPTERIMDSNCLLATIYHCFGIDTTTSYLTNAGRPIPILTTGTPIAE